MQHESIYGDMDNDVYLITLVETKGMVRICAKSKEEAVRRAEKLYGHTVISAEMVLED